MELTAREFLQQAFTIDKEIRSKREQIQQLRTMQESLGGVLVSDRVQSTPKHDKLGEVTAAIVDLENEYIEDVVKLLVVKTKVRKIIAGVENATYRTLLELRYVNLLRWEEIACVMTCNWRTVHKWHRKAILGIEGQSIDMI